MEERSVTTLVPGRGRQIRFAGLRRGMLARPIRSATGICIASCAYKSTCAPFLLRCSGRALGLEVLVDNIGMIGRIARPEHGVVQPCPLNAEICPSARGSTVSGTKHVPVPSSLMRDPCSSTLTRLHFGAWSHLMISKPASTFASPRTARHKPVSPLSSKREGTPVWSHVHVLAPK